MPGLTTPLAYTFVSGILTGDATLLALGTAQGSTPLSDGLRVYRDAIPQGEKYPAIIFWVLSPGIPLRVIGTEVVWSDLVMGVKAIDTGTSLDANLRAIANRVDVLMENASGTVSGGEVFGVRGEQEICYPDPPQGSKRWMNLGRQYRIWAK